MYIIPTIIIEVLHLVTYVNCFKHESNDITVATSFVLKIATIYFNYKAAPTNNIDYSCHITAIELVQPFIWGPHHAISCHVTVPVINSLGPRHTYTYTQ